MESNGGGSGVGGVEETSLDMLKNTPSNIKKLAHEIEQWEGRQKYLAYTRSPSDGGDVRWYFCKVPLEVNGLVVIQRRTDLISVQYCSFSLAASIPRTEIVGKGDYFRFGMRDSLAIEASFLQREDELLSTWWKEHAECSEGSKGTSMTPQTEDLLSEWPKSGQLCAAEEERVGVPVKGGLHEVDLTTRHCFPVYWNGDNRRVLRGQWFARKGRLDWLPLREDVSEQLEYAYCNQVWHRRTFQLSGRFAARVDLQGSNPGLHALFTGEDDTWEAWLSLDASGLSNIVGFGGNGIKLRRGYAPSQSQKPTQDELRQQHEEELDDYRSQVPVRHLVFMVHGVGQSLEKSNLVDDVGDFRHITASLAERHLTSYQLGTQRVLYIPCQWRKGLTLGGEVSVEKITLDGVCALRTMLSATVHDVLYYMSPIYCQEIIDSVSNQLNKLYLKYLKRNPGYDGKVSIYGHSLGSVLSYDILCHQETLYSPFPVEWTYKDLKPNEAPCSNSNNLTSSCNPISISSDESSENAEIENIAFPVDFLNLFEEPLEGTFSPLSPLASSESDVSSTAEIGYQQTNDTSSSDENTKEPFCNSNPIESYITDMTNDNDVDVCDDDNNNNKAETIEALKEEIDLLKAKIKEFEAECADKVANQSDPGRVQHGHRDSLKSYAPQIRYTKLDFKVDTFFDVGSPLGVFLSLRNIRIGIGKGKEYWVEENIHEEMPACRRMFNIFHPFDPVAYRIEPLICKEFISKRPFIIPYHRGGKRLYVGFQEFKEGLASCSQAFMDHLSTVRVKVLTLCESRCDHSLDGTPSLCFLLPSSAISLREDISNLKLPKKEKSYGSLMMGRLIGREGGQIDHVLQDKTFRHPYISAIGAHTNYCRDHDTALFIIKHLYGDIPEEPNCSKDENNFNCWSDPRVVVADEVLPLTFADSVFTKHFSHKVKKMTKY